MIYIYFCCWINHSSYFIWFHFDINFILFIFFNNFFAFTFDLLLYSFSYDFRLIRNLFFSFFHFSMFFCYSKIRRHQKLKPVKTWFFHSNIWYPLWWCIHWWCTLSWCWNFFIFLILLFHARHDVLLHLLFLCKLLMLLIFFRCSLYLFTFLSKYF